MLSAVYLVVVSLLYLAFVLFGLITGEYDPIYTQLVYVVVLALPLFSAKVAHLIGTKTIFTRSKK